MKAFNGARAVSVEIALDLHEAAGVIADYVFDFGFEDAVAFHLGHRGGDLRKLHGEHPAEAAARFAFDHLDEFEAFDGAEEFARGLGQ